MDTLLAGGVKRPITPTVKGRRVYIAGYGSGRLATDIHDELWVRALSIQLGDVVVVLVALDLLGLLQTDVEFIQQQAIEAGLPAQNLIIACTCNHAGPDTIGHWSKGAFGTGLNIRYLHFLRQEVVRVIHLAVSNMRPVEAYFARSEVPELSGGEEGQELEVLQLRGEAGEPVYTLVNYPLVPRVLGEANTTISADFVSRLYRELERTRQEIVLYTCAGASTGFPKAQQERPWEEAEEVGRRLAQAVRQAIHDASHTPIERLEVWHRKASIPADAPVESWLKRTGLLGRASLAEGRTESQVGLIQLGPARIAVLPGLVAPELGFDIRKMLDAPFRFLLCMANDTLGFILPQGLTGPAVPGPEQDGFDSLSSVQVGTIILDELDDMVLEARQG